MNEQTGYIYLIKAGEHYKIGKSKDVARRMRQFQLPIPIELLHTIPVSDMQQIERYLHHRFADQRGLGEWFALSPDDVAWICSFRPSDFQPELPQPTIAIRRRTAKLAVRKPEKLKGLDGHTVEEVARLFRVSEQTIRLWIKAGKLKSKKVGRAHLIPAASVQALLDATNGESSGNSLPVLLAAA